VKALSSIQQAQAASKDLNHDKFWRVNSLPADRIEQTVEMLKRHSPRTVAELLQEDGYHTDIKAISLSHILEKYRAEKIPAHQLISPYLVERLTSELKRNVNVFSEMSDLITLQRNRIRAALLVEEESGQLLPETNKQLHLQARMIKVFGDLGLKSGLLSEFIQTYLQESQLADEAMTRETRSMFLRFFQYKMQAGGLDEVLTELTNIPEDSLAE
jgi:hypothetical protein